MSSGLYSGQPGLSLGTGLYRTVSGLWSGASGLAMAFGGAGMPLSLNFLTMTAYTLDPRITFSRGSQAMVTDATGKLTYAPNNLLTNSESFEASAWVKFNSASVVANTVAAPNGTTTADTLSLTSTANSRIEQTVTVVSGASYIFSVWMRVASGTLSVRLYGIDTGGGSAFTVTTNWQRFSITQTASSATRYPAIVTDGTAGDVYIWGAQLEAVTYQTTPSPYVSTTPKNLLGYTQEFDNAAWTKSNAFVQTNLLTYSEQFDNAAWSKNAVTVTANAATSPDGTATADAITETTAAANHQIYRLPGLGINTYTYSFYAKANGRTQVQVEQESGGNSRFTLTGSGSAVALGANSVSITSVGNGWYRCSTTFTVTGVFGVYLLLYNGSTTNYTGDGTSGIFIWGAQLVQGATAGDYQQTFASAAAVQYTAPDGTRSADKLVETTVNGGHYVLQSITALAIPYTFSAYVKAAERTFAMIYNAQTNAGQVINLATGALAGNAGLSAPTSSSVTDVGNGWYLLSMTITATAASNNFRIYAMSDATTFNYAGDGTSGIYIWGAQLSNSASVDPYVYNPVAAPSSTAYYGPRFDYDPVTLAPKGLLIEEQRTNLLVRSQEFNNASWGATSVSVGQNAATSPDGTANAESVTGTAVSDRHYVRQSQTVTSSTSYAFTAFVKANGYTVFALREGNTTGAWAQFDISAGTVRGSGNGGTGSIQSVGNGWYRCSLVCTTGAAQTFFAADLYLLSSAQSIVDPGNILWKPDGTSGIFIYGAQLEAGAFATSYIPTVASQVTRTADVATITGANFSNWYNQSAGSFVAEFTTTTLNASGATVYSAVSADAGSGANQLSLYTYSNFAAGRVVTGSVTQADINGGGSPANNTVIKSGIAYAANNVAVTVNGATPGTDTSVTLPTVDRLSIGSQTGGNYLNGWLRSISYYNTRLPNLQLQALTS